MPARPPHRVVVALLLGIALALAPVAAAAQGKPNDAVLKAREQGRAAFALYDAGKWTEAFEAFRKADETYHAPTFVFHMGQCRKNLGELVAARDLYKRVADEAIPPDAHEAFRKAQSDARDELAAIEKRIPKLSVEIAGATTSAVTVDGVAVASGALGAVEVDPGDHLVRVVPGDAGLAPQERTAKAVEGTTTKVAFAFGAVAPPPPRSAEVAPAPEAGGGSVVPAAVALGVGGVGLAVGAVTGLMTLSEVDDLESRCVDSHCPAADQGQADDAGTLATISTIGFVAGGVGVAAGVALLVFDPFGGDAPAATSGRAAPRGPEVRAAFGPGSVLLRGRF